METKNAEFVNAVRECRNLVRDSERPVNVTVTKRSNNYYDTEIIPVKKGSKELFSLCVKSDNISANYVLSYDNNEFVPDGWLQIRKIKRLRRFLKRCAHRQYKSYIR
jgi:hypothetical protein